MKDKKRICSGIIVIALTLLCIVLNLGYSFGALNGNYSSDKFKISFQYPAYWEIHKKSTGNERGPFVEIINVNPEGTMLDQNGTRFNALLTISALAHDIPLHSFSDFNSYVEKLQNKRIDRTDNQSAFNNATFMTIDGKQAGTFVFTGYPDDNPNSGTFKQQTWIVITKDFGYFISFLANPASFNSPENTQVRDQFIKSIKFLE